MLKCKRGYLKKEGAEGFSIALFEKASVFRNIDNEELNSLRQQGILSGIDGLSLVMLTITEKVLKNY